MSPFWTNALIDVLLFIYVADCIFMGLVIMMQRSKQEGLGAAFGGGFTDSIWGAQTSNVLVKATVWSAIIFFVLSLALARLHSSQPASIAPASSVDQELLAPSVPVKPPTTNTIVQPVAPATTPAAPVTNEIVTPATPVTPAPVSPAKTNKPAKH